MAFVLPGGALIETDGTVSDVTDEASPIRLFTETGREMTIPRWRDQPAFQAWLRTYLEEFQEIELMLWDVLVLRFLDFAEGAALDQWGRILDVARGARTDGSYRARLKVQISINASQGRAPDLVSILRTLGDAQFSYRAHQDAVGFQVEFHDQLPAETWVEVPSILRDARAAGVSGSVVGPQPNAIGAMRYGDIASRPSVGGPCGDIASRPSVGAGLADYRRT